MALSEATRKKIRDARLRQKNVAFGVPGVPNIRIIKWWEELHKDPERYEMEMAKRRGRKVWNKGKPWNNEVRKKLSIARQKRVITLETRKKLAATQRANIAALGHGYNRGCKQTAESVAKRQTTIEQNGTRKMPPIRRGPAHHNWGKPAPKGSGIGKGSHCLKGHWVRSTWERTVADWFFTNNVPYEYEPQIFDLANGLRYRPDFYLPKWKLWVEVKGYLTAESKNKFRQFKKRHRLVIIGKDEMNQLQEMI